MDGWEIGRGGGGGGWSRNPVNEGDAGVLVALDAELAVLADLGPPHRRDVCVSRGIERVSSEGWGCS